MKKLAITVFIAALLGGGIAVGGYKLFESKQIKGFAFDDRQPVHYASNTTSGTSSSAGNPDFVQAAAAVAPAVVHIKTQYSRSASTDGSSPFDMFEEFFGAPRGNRQQQSRPQEASGSGVIISQDGYIVTNNHVVEGADKVFVEMTNKKVYDAKIIGRDPSTDLALIKVNDTNLPTVKVGNSDDVQIGEWVLAVGYPLGLQSTVTAGIVSAKSQKLGILDQQQQEMYRDPKEPPVSRSIESYIQTDAAINKGNSGGALVNANGELVGINAALASPTGYYAGYGFAIPVNLMKKITDDFVKYGKIKRGYVGVTFTELNSDAAKELKINEIRGLYVQEVIPDGGAAGAGIKKGDVITKLEDRPVYSGADLQEKVATMNPGDKVAITYKRDGKEKTVSVTLKEQSSSTEGEGASSGKVSGTDLYNKLGVGFVPATEKQKQTLKISSGIVVADVQRGGLFGEFGIPKGLIITAINGQKVNNVDEVENALSSTKNNIVRIEGVTSDGWRSNFSFPVK